MSIRPPTTYPSRWFTHNDAHITYAGVILGDITFLESTAGPLEIDASTTRIALRASTTRVSKTCMVTPRIDRRGSMGLSLAASTGMRSLTAIPDTTTTITVPYDRLPLHASSTRVAAGASTGSLAKRATFTTRVEKSASLKPRIDRDAELSPMLEGTGSP